MPDRREGPDLQKWVVPILPVLFAALGWLITSINEQDRRILNLQGQMMMLVDPNGQIIPSPNNAIARQNLKEEITETINDLKVRVSLLEQGK
jgi:hypothetical protein